MSFPILSVRGLKLYYRSRRGIVRAVDDVDFDLNRGETLAIVGESGCGKSSTARCLIRLLPRNVEKYSGNITIDGIEVMSLRDEEFNNKIRWKKISMVFQGALNALNPVLKVGDQVAEPLILHKKMSKKEALEIARRMIKAVGIPEGFVNRYPFELSGGMRQRVVIAMSLVTDPEIIILDEPTSALDVITQANIMNMLKRLKAEKKFSYILITHDIGLSSELADKVATMYAGQIVELSRASEFYKEPLHPYAKSLMASVPTLREDKELRSLPGEPPSLIDPPKGCRFHPRCPYAKDICREKEPPSIDVNGHMVKCWLYG